MLYKQMFGVVGKKILCQSAKYFVVVYFYTQTQEQSHNAVKHNNRNVDFFNVKKVILLSELYSTLENQHSKIS